MKIALIHDYLNQYGGAERVLEELISIFPKADVFTLFYDSEKTFHKFAGKIKKTSFLDCQFVKDHHRFFIPLMPLAAENINLKKEYDIIISSTAGYAKGIKYKKGFHICYCHTPLRYAWEIENYLTAKFNQPAAKILEKFLSPVAGYLKRWDLKAGWKPDVLIANSKFIAGKIEKYYKRHAEIIYPPVNTKIFYNKNPFSQRFYFLAAGRLIHYKKFDLIIKAFNKLELPLKIVGRGPDLKKLRKISVSKNISFVPAFLSDEEMREIYNNAFALIFPQVEDFGLVAAEAVACGTPVIAFADGGALEIINGKNGLFFYKQNPESIIDAVQKFKKKKFNSLEISAAAQKFSQENFRKKIIEKIYRI